MLSPFDQKPTHLQGILTVTPDGKTYSPRPDFFRGKYLAKLLKAAKQLGTRSSDTKYPDWADNGARRALVDFFAPKEALASEVDTVVWHTKPDGWVGNRMKERLVRTVVKKDLAGRIRPTGRAV